MGVNEYEGVVLSLRLRKGMVCKAGAVVDYRGALVRVIIDRGLIWGINGPYQVEKQKWKGPASEG